jgi:hypothetical protein
VHDEELAYRDLLQDNDITKLGIWKKMLIWSEKIAL